MEFDSKMQLRRQACQRDSIRYDDQEAMGISSGHGR